MTVYPVTAQDSVALQGGQTAYDSLWAAQEIAATSAFERTMLAEDKLYVVLAVVLIIWFGILIVLFRNERRIKQLEQRVDALPLEDLD